MAVFQLEEAQFRQLDTQIGGLNGAINKLAEAVAPEESSVHTAIAEMSANLAKWQAEQMKAITNGFILVAEVLANRQEPGDQSKIDAIKQDLKTEADAFEQSITQSEGE